MLSRIVLFSALSIFALNSQAGILDSLTINSDLRQLATDPSDTHAAQKLSARMLYSTKAAPKIFSEWSGFKDQSDYPETWGWLGVKLLGWTEQGRRYDWNRKVESPGVRGGIYQQDSLVDLDRVRAITANYGTIAVDGFEIADRAKPEFAKPRLSRDLMVTGLAPIGPDNQAIKVCKLGRSSAAPYLELSESQRVRFQVITKLDISSCLEGYASESYWKARLGDFVDQYHDITPNHRPGGSW